MFNMLIMICLIAYGTFILKNILSHVKKPANHLKIDNLSLEFKYKLKEIQASNKNERISEKLAELKNRNIHVEIAKDIINGIMLQIAEDLVEKDKQDGKLDELYSVK